MPTTNTIKHKRSSTPGAIPSVESIEQSELAINLADGKLYTKNNNNEIINLAVSSISGTVITPASGILDTITFNNIGDPDLTARQLAWNDTEGSLALGVSDSYAMYVGEELHYRVRNATGSTILAGTPVYATGLTPGGNNRIEIAPYTADGNIREVRFMGLMTEDCDTGLNGYTTHFGYIRNIDTRGDAVSNGTTNKLWTTNEPAWNEGDILYVHPSVAGKLTKVEPKHSISVAIVLNKASNGKLFVRPTSYGHIDDNHDVNTSGVANNDYLKYDSATSTWVPDSFEDNVMALLPTSVKGTFLLTEPSGTFSVDEGYTVGTLDVFLNGVKLSSYAGDYTADDAQTFTLSEIAPSGSIIEYLALMPSNNNPVGGGINLTSSGTAPSNPSVGDMWFNTDTGNLFIYIDDGSSSNWLEPFGPAGPAGSGIFASIEEFNTGVSGLLPITDIVSGDNISITSSGTVYTVSVSGQLGLTTEQVDDRVASLLSPASGIVIDYDDNNNLLYISTSGLQPSGDYANLSHSHTSDQITNFNTSVSGLLPVTNISAGSYINVSQSGTIFTVFATGLQPSGNYSIIGHNHISSDITDFNSGVSGLLPSVSGSGYVNSSFNNNIYTISVTGLQPSGNYSLEGHNHIISDISGLQTSLDSKQPSGTYASGIHTHLVSDIIDFNSEVSGLLPVKDIVGGSGILIEISSGIYTIAATGTSVSSTTSFSRGWFLS